MVGTVSRDTHAFSHDLGSSRTQRGRRLGRFVAGYQRLRALAARQRRRVRAGAMSPRSSLRRSDVNVLIAAKARPGNASCASPSVSRGFDLFTDAEDLWRVCEWFRYSGCNFIQASIRLPSSHIRTRKAVFAFSRLSVQTRHWPAPGLPVAGPVRPLPSVGRRWRPDGSR